jgi:hypothetical protein
MGPPKSAPKGGRGPAPLEGSMVSHDSFRFGQPAIELIGECLTLSRSEVRRAARIGKRDRSGVRLIDSCCPFAVIVVRHLRLRRSLGK